VTALLDLNDAALALWTPDAVLLSPAYARWHNDRYHFGLGAQSEARLHPREISTRYWSQLSLQPLVPALGRARHSADLVHTQLQDMLTQQPAETILLVVPGHFSREQVSLLLGILETLPTQVAAVVHRSAAIAGTSHVSDGCHVEVQLQQTVMTSLTVDGDSVVAGDTQSVSGFGWLWLLDRLAEAVAAQFVEQTRFDPQRKASSEQSLYDELPALLAALTEHSEHRLEIDGYSARVQREPLARVGQQWREELQRVTGERHWLVNSDIARLPGFDTEGLSLRVERDHWQRQILAAAPSFQQDADGLHLQRKVALSGEISHADGQSTAAADADIAPASPAHERVNATLLPTHLLIDDRATPLRDRLTLAGDAELQLNDGVPKLAGHIAPDLMINNERASAGQRLKLGDTLSDSLGFAARLIHVEE
jgi:hypothetical protein